MPPAACYDRYNNHNAFRDLPKSMLKKHIMVWSTTGALALVFLIFYSTIISTIDTTYANPQASWMDLYAEVLVLGIAGIALCVLLPQLNPIKSSILTVFLIIPFLLMGMSSARTDAVIPMEYSLLTILMLFGLDILINWFVETRRNQQLMTAFGQYVPSEIVHEIERNPDGFSMDGEAREMTVLFCDIKNFTQISESLEPGELVRVLNAVFDPLTEVTYRHKGTIDKYMGDAVMAFWGAPVKDPDHAANATLAALEMQQMLKRLRNTFIAKGWPEIHMGIGINTGKMNVGNMGSRYRLSYTVVGDSVNLASRLESATRTLFANIVVSHDTYKLSPHLLFRELGTVRVKGKANPLRVFEPLCTLENARAQLRGKVETHSAALKAFYAKDWATALKLFGKLWAQYPDDKLYGLYVESIGALSRIELPDTWQGELSTRREGRDEITTALERRSPSLEDTVNMDRRELNKNAD